MKRVLTAAVLIPLVLLAVFRAPLWLFALLILAIALLAIREYLDILEGYDVRAMRKTTYIMCAILVLGEWASWDKRIWISTSVIQLPWLFRNCYILAVLPLVFGIPLVFRRDLRGALSAAAGSAFGVIYIAASLTLLILLRNDYHQAVLVLFVLLSVWAGDTAAYYVGRNLGRHKLAPIVSPKKTWEGAVASVIASVAVAWLVFYFYIPIRNLFPQATPFPYSFYSVPGAQDHVAWVRVIVLGIVTNVAAQFGDLFESALKRGAQIKDSGSLLPGHGGILDRIDALLFAVPVVWYYANLIGFLLPNPADQ